MDVNTVTLMYHDGINSHSLHPHIADVNSKFKQTRELAFAKNDLGNIVHYVTTNVSYYIDDTEVSREVFEEVSRKLSDIVETITNKECKYKTIHDMNGVTVWQIDLEGADSMSWIDYLTADTKWHYPWGKDWADCYMNGIIADINARQAINNTYTKEKIEMKNTNNNKKNMITIRNYTYEVATGKTTIFWSDNTQTTVVAEPNTESSQYVGFVSACAKKLFGNKSTYLNQFDKWAVKIPAKRKAEAEKKVAEEKARTKAMAEKKAKQEARAEKRVIDSYAKEIMNDFEEEMKRRRGEDVYSKAEKIAVEKLGVPTEYINRFKNPEAFDKYVNDSMNKEKDETKTETEGNKI